MAAVAAVVALSARLPDPATVPDGPPTPLQGKLCPARRKEKMVTLRSTNPIYMRVGADSGRKVPVIKQDTNII